MAEEFAFMAAIW